MADGACARLSANRVAPARSERRASRPAAGPDDNRSAGTGRARNRSEQAGRLNLEINTEQTNERRLAPAATGLARAGKASAGPNRSE